MNKIIKYVLLDILRNRVVLAYTAFLLLISLSVFNLEDSASKGMLSLLQVVLIIVPLVSIVFSTIYMYNASEFIELLVAQPLRRSALWGSIFLALLLALSIALLAGIGIPVLLYCADIRGATLAGTALALSAIFVAIAMLASVLTRDKAKGIGISILLWFYFALIYDGLVLFFLFQFSDYPLETPMVALTALNPIDLARILMLLQLDISALLGYTGAVFREIFGGTTGILLSALVMLAWCLTPYWFSRRKFIRKDL